MKNHLLSFLFIITASLCGAQTPTLWGITNAQGNDHVGTIIQTNSTGSAFKKDYSFTEPGFGLKNIMQAGNGLLYGMNGSGGAYNKGIIFSYDITTGTETDLHDFGSGTDGFDDIGSLFQASNGLLYGMTEEGGFNGAGIIFSYNITTSAYKVLYNFGNGTDGNDPKGTFIQLSNGLLYGVTEAGGVNGKGTIFSYNITTGAETDLYDFGSGTDGQLPQCALLQASNGLLYGTTYLGGIYGEGIMFSYDITTGAETDVHDFEGNAIDGSYPYGALMQASNGLIYGMTQFGGANAWGIILSYDITTGAETDLHDFGSGDGEQGAGVLLQASNGLLYGVTETGGTNAGGIILSYNITTGTEAIVYNFSLNPDLKVPCPGGGLIQASNGLLYGTTDGGGINSGGSIFSYNISLFAETDLHDFSIILDGQSPRGSPVIASNGLLYGLTTYGGAYDKGAIFNYNFSTSLDTILYSFGSGTDGEYPWYSSLIQASNGLLYGMTSVGGVIGDGMIFSYNATTGKETDVFDFGNGSGYLPFGSLVQASNGLLYGMTYSGGTNDEGTIFSYDITTNTETNLYDFGVNGYYPYGSLVQANNGLLYGMTEQGGTYDEGTVFSYNITTNTEADIYNFGTATNDGYYPYGSLIQANNGLLYGMTVAGGANGLGTIFSYDTTTATETDLHDFGSGTDGQDPYGSLLQASDGLLYGMTSEGGANDYGIVFNYNINTGVETDIHDFEISDGANPYGNLVEDDSILSVTPSRPAICEGASVALTVNGAASYTWTPSTGLNTTTGDSVIANPTATTTYTVMGKTGGSTITTTVTVTVIPVPPLIIQPQLPSICPGQNVTLGVTPSGSGYMWSPALTLSSSTGDTVVATPTVTTTYSVTGTDSLGCNVSASDVVSISNAPNKPTIVHSGNDLISSATQGNQWLRNDTVLQGATNQTYIITLSGWYQVIAANPANGCSTTSDSVDITTGINQLTVESGQVTVYPNPTGGEINMNISSSAIDVEDWNLQIIDVLGRTVYFKQSLNYNNAIDLTNLSSGVYFICVINKTGRVVVPVVKQ